MQTLYYSKETVYYSDDKRHAMFNGVKYSKNKKGYYCATLKSNSHNPNIGKLHRAVWSYHKGDIPMWYDIHHKDGNKENNNIDNLICIEHSRHQKHHIEVMLSEVTRDCLCINCNNPFIPNEPSQIYCSARCGNQYRHKQKMVYYNRVCTHCGKPFTTNRIDRTYCCNMCGQAERTKSYRKRKREALKSN